MKAPEAAHTHHLAERLAESGADIHVLTSAEVGPISSVGYTVHPLMNQWGWLGLMTILQTIRRSRPDAVLIIYHHMLYWDHPMISLLPLLGRLASTKARFVTQFEHVSLNPLRWPKVAQWLFRRLRWPGKVATNFGLLLVASDRLVFLNNQYRELVRPCAPKAIARSSVIPAPPIMTILSRDEGKTRAQGRQFLGIKENELLLAYFGYIYRSKGIDTLIKALAIASPRLGRFRLLLIGDMLLDGYRDEMRQLASDLGLDGNITWTGYCKPEEASLYLHAADLCILPFTQGLRLNNSSFAVVASHGLAVLSTAGPDLEPQFIHGENVWLCPPQDPKAMSIALERLATDKELRKKLQGGVDRLTEEWFSWDSVVSKTRQVLLD